MVYTVFVQQINTDAPEKQLTEKVLSHMFTNTYISRHIWSRKAHV